MGAERIHESYAFQKAAEVLFVTSLHYAWKYVVAGKYCMILSMCIPDFSSKSLTLSWPSSLVHKCPLLLVTKCISKEKNSWKVLLSKPSWRACVSWC